MKIAVAEDEEGTQIAVKVTLKDYARSLYFFTTIADLRLYLKRNPDTDLILLDLNLLDSIWSETLLEVPIIREWCPYAAVVLMSGVANNEELRKAAQESGADAFVHKPEDFTNAQLQQVLLAVFSRTDNRYRPETFHQHLQMLETYVRAKQQCA